MNDLEKLARSAAYDNSWKEINFDDIKVGDTIAEMHENRGIIYTRIGVVGKKTAAQCHTGERTGFGTTIARAGGERMYGFMQLYLVDRPDPVLPSEPGVRIKNIVDVHGGRYTLGIPLQDGGGTWLVVDENGGTFDTLAPAEIALWELE